MFRSNIGAILKFGIGVFLVQAATVLLVIASQRTEAREVGLLMVALGLLIGAIAALWFSSIASHCSQAALAVASEKFSKERERLRKTTEKEKTREIKESHKELLRETRRLHQRVNFRLGAGLAAIATLGFGLVFTQFVTLGLLALSLGGGAALGYVARARQGRLPRVVDTTATLPRRAGNQDSAVLLPPAKPQPGRRKGQW